MELLSGIWDVAFTLLAFVFVLSIVVFVHEYGHYIIGRWCGIRAETFSIGFWKEIFGWTDRRGTRWRVSVLPLGGYVKFLGDSDPASAGKTDESLSAEENAASFHGAALWKRAATVAAGPIANFLLSIVLFTGIILVHGKESNVPVIGTVSEGMGAEMQLMPGDTVLAVNGEPVEDFSAIITGLRDARGEVVPVEVDRDGQVLTVTATYDMPPFIVGLVEDGAAISAGVAPGDRILRYNGQPVPNFHDLQIMIAETPVGTEVTLEVDRGGTERSFTFLPKPITKEHPLTGVEMEMPQLGVYGGSADGSYGGIAPPREGVGFGEAVGYGAAQTWGIIDRTVGFVYKMIRGQADTALLGGPITIAKESGKAAERGFAWLIKFIAIISTAIGFLNLFPIPVLDGGHLVFYAAEAVRGKPLGEQWLKAATAVGLTLVLLLMVFATYNDLMRF